MTLREQAELLAGQLIELAGLDGRRGAVADAAIAGELHARPLLLVEVLEVLAQRCASSPATWERSGHLTSQLLEHCRDAPPVGDVL